MKRSMEDVSANEGRSRPQDRLDARYGEIGISAVVAAMRYRAAPAPKNPAYADEAAEAHKPVQHKAA